MVAGDSQADQPAWKMNRAAAADLVVVVMRNLNLIPDVRLRIGVVVFLIRGNGNRFEFRRDRCNTLGV